MKKLILILAYLLLAVPCAAEIIIVDNDWPYDFNNIQAAIDYSSNGDFIVVFPGTYTGPGNYEIDFLGKAVTVRSVDPTDPYIVAQTVIDCNSLGNGLNFQSGEDANSVLAGFTITNGITSFGGGIYCGGESNPKISNCVITENSGSGIHCDYASPTVADCIITGNQGSGRDGDDGGGISVFGGLCLVYNSIITGNTANRYGGGICCDIGGGLEITSSIIAGNLAGVDGGGIYCSGGSLEITNCTIADNVASNYGGGIFSQSEPSPSITNSIIWGNIDSTMGQSTQIYYNNEPDVWFSCIQDDTNDVNVPFGEEQFNIEDDPCFVDPDGNDFHLQSDSPCIDTGDPNFVPKPNETDIDSKPRIMGGRVDMGADELTAELIPIIFISDDNFSFSAVLGGADPDTQILSIYNMGAGTLNWEIIEDCSWLTAEPNSGSSTGQVDNVNLMVDISALTGGMYYCGMTISDPNALNSPQSIDITLSVDANSGPTIQAAINTASDGDIVVISSGTYTGPGNRDLDFHGKAITVISENGPNSCIIDCNGLGRGFYFHTDEGPNSVIDGFTITNGYSPDGGGIFCGSDCSPLITNCIITGNSASDRGGGIGCFYSGAIINNCIIAGNSSVNNGGGIFCYDSPSPEIINCTIIGNSSVDYGGGIACYESLPAITNSIIWDNIDSSAGQSAQIYDDGEMLNVWFSCLQDDNPNDLDIPYGEDAGNIDDDPCFVQPGYWDANSWVGGDYHLLASSPCIETGDPYFAYNPGNVDIDGQPRLMGQYVDMGSDEVELSVIVVTNPQVADVWTAGSTHQINWDSYDVNGTVDIYYSDNNGTEWVIIDGNLPDTGSYTWLLPGAVDSNRCIVAVDPNVPTTNFICIESGLFTIHPDSPGSPVASNWKSLGGDFDRSGLSQYHGPELGCIKWQFQTEEPVSASPTVGANGQIHLSCEDGKLYTLDPNGQLLWSYDANSPLLSSPSIGPDGSVFVGAQNGKLYAIDVNGNLRWTHRTDSFIYSSPAVTESGNVYVCSEDGTLYALGPDGSELWTFETAGPGVVSGAIFASPAIATDGTVYISGLYDPNLYALDPNNGSVKWSCAFSDSYEPPGPKFQIFASPVIAPDGTIYQALLNNPARIIGDEEEPEGFWYDSKLYAIDSNNGSIIWETNMTETATDNEWYGEPNYLFRQYYTYVPEQGTPRYPYTDTDFVSGTSVLRYYRVNNSGCFEPVLAPDGTIYVSFDDQYLRAVDPNGTIKWVTSLGWLGGFTPTVGSNGLVYAASKDGDLYVIDPDGKQIARFGSNSWLNFPVITDNNSIIVADADNTLWAISRDDCEGQPADLHRPEDLNADWSVDFIDFAVMANLWLNCTDTSYNIVTEAPCCDYSGEEPFLMGDINRDQYIDSIDLEDLANRWLNQE